MPHDDQARHPEERGSASARADAFSLSSFSSSSSGDGSLATDGGDEGNGGHVSLVMNDLLSQPPPASVNVANSTDVHIGPSLHYNGPVTINQFLNLQQLDAAALEQIPLPQARLSNGTGKAVLSGVASSGVGACAEAGKRTGGDGASGSAAPWWRRPKVLVAAGALVVLLAGVVTMMALLWPASRGASSESSPRGSRTHTSGSTTSQSNVTDSTPDRELLLGNGQRIFRRSDWSDWPPTSRRPLRHPTPYVVVGHTAGPACVGEAECFPLLCTYRDLHRNAWLQPDISYNFLIDVAGNVYEGRGWDATNNYAQWVKRCNLAVSFFGNFENDNATVEMEEALRQLLDLGVSLGKLDPQYRLLAHNQVSVTLSPGRNVLALIQRWPNRCLNRCAEGVQCLEVDATTAAPSANRTGGS